MNKGTLSDRRLSLLQSILDLRKSTSPLVRVFSRSWGGWLHYYFVVGIADIRLKQNRISVTDFNDAVLVAKTIAFVFGARYEDLKDIFSFEEFLYLSGRESRSNESDRQ